MLTHEILKENKTKQSNDNVFALGRLCVCVRFSYTFERFLSGLFLPCEVAVLISRSQTCFFSTHKTSEDAALFWH